MKLFTKIALGIAGFFAGIAVICMVLAFTLGFQWADFQKMMYEGKFRFGPEDVLSISFFEEKDTDMHHGEEHYLEDDEVCEIPHECTRIFVAYGAGALDVSYDDVSSVQIVQENVEKCSVTSSEADKTLYIEGGLDVTEDSDASLRIILPEGAQLEIMDLEIGASQAEICDLTAEECNIAVGARCVNLSDVCIDKLNLEVGVGHAEIKNLSVQELDVETVIGDIDIEIAGAETDYNYGIECGIGEVIIENTIFQNLDEEKNITNIDTNHHMEIDCDMGTVCLHFTCDATNETCEDMSHHHKGH